VEITPERDLVEVAFVVCTALNRTGTVTVLTGGSAATYYAPSAYQSRDADFIIVMNGTSAKPNEALARLGYSEHGGIYHHANSEFTWNPPGPLAVGSDIISTYETYHRDELMLHVLSRTDSVRDRLAGFYHWDDRSGLRVALDVAMGGPIDLETVERWSVHEHQGANLQNSNRTTNNSPIVARVLIFRACRFTSQARTSLSTGARIYASTSTKRCACSDAPPTGNACSAVAAAASSPLPAPRLQKRRASTKPSPSHEQTDVRLRERRSETLASNDKRRKTGAERRPNGGIPLDELRRRRYVESALGSLRI